jgi:hypothetical protein
MQQWSDHLSGNARSPEGSIFEGTVPYNSCMFLMYVPPFIFSMSLVFDSAIKYFSCVYCGAWGSRDITALWEFFYSNTHFIWCEAKTALQVAYGGTDLFEEQWDSCGHVSEIQDLGTKIVDALMLFPTYSYLSAVLIYDSECK